MNKKDKNFYDTYDTLFSKPPFFKPKKENNMQNYKKYIPKLKQEKLQKKKVLGKSSLSRSKAKPKKNSWKKKLVVCVVLFLPIAFFVIKEKNLAPVLYSEYLDVTPLKEAGIKGTGDKDFSKPLMLNVDDHTILTNRGYELEVLGDSDLEIQKEELSVLPTNNEYADYFSTAYISFYSERRFQRSVSLRLSENVINSLTESFIKNKRSFSKAYLEKEIGDVQNGYVVTYVKSPYPEITICRFFIFPDETGIWIDLNSLEDDHEELTEEKTLEEFKEILSDDFAFIEKNFVFKKTE
ncbi:hypothetical protein [Enterococcus ureasiticus]|uniref:Uncharacterized protein n=1 Tax=Enterococcus ureasiticus TaxID=903984 RepID=A0A1E5GAD3_9ENTE|nr:hypothetical protein [Enterococcus ureasiticus]OEG09555.1 hypothetical protein BCR21_14495 [Enterococcus ureasiticus]